MAHNINRKAIKTKGYKMITTPYVTIDGHEYAPLNDELSLKKAVAHQPISIMIYVTENMRFYRSGVYTGPCEDGFGNHDVLAVGYGTTEGGEDY
ncbi:hypothetical protein Bca52824_019039 [Brassica carinata]|uniref:Peptidase C1A papain C-terminal domain-containing protein n=1 Tax=Brassica carinata TaxID=52824 RepID=A0A8X7VRM3_BRACI|nr:hypothetical protein Bca52824_019039 [Brassica carinata]